MKDIKEIIDEMRMLWESDQSDLGDPEVDHFDADRLLVQMIRKLGQGHEYESDIEKFLSTYSKLTKWYN